MGYTGTDSIPPLHGNTVKNKELQFYILYFNKNIYYLNDKYEDRTGDCKSAYRQSKTWL